MSEELESRDYTAVFTLVLPAGESEERWREVLGYFQNDFDAQWMQSGDSPEGWTVTIHPERPIGDGTR